MSINNQKIVEMCKKQKRLELLLDTRLHNSASMAVRHVNLGGNPKFNETYIDQIFFPET